MFTFLSFFSAPTLTLGENIVNWYQNSLLRELLDYFNARYFSVELGLYENFSVTAKTGATVRNIILALAAAIIVAAFVTAYTRIRLGAFVRSLIAEGCLSEEDARTLLEIGYFRNAAVRKALSGGSALRLVVRRVGDGLPPVVEKVTDGEGETVEESAETNGEETPTEETPTEETSETAVEMVETATEVDAEDAENASRVEENAARVAKNAEKIDFTTARFYIPEALRHRAEIRFDPKGSGWRSAILVSVLAVVTAGVLCFFVPELIQFADNLIGWLGT